VEDVPSIFSLLLHHSPTKDRAVSKVFMLVEDKYCDQIRQLSLRGGIFPLGTEPCAVS
jgi:hypothetical protein